MLQTEYLRSLNSNYERILLDKKPEERKYQYCIISRGGIKGLLSCSLRYINGLAYLYYDISSKQSITQICDRHVISRKWMKDFFWSMRHIQLELGRFLLDERNILWYPQQIYQDLESNIFSFLYVPYYEGDNGFHQLLEYFVEHIDYEDEVLVDCVYKMYEQFENAGEIYLQERIFQDVKLLEGGDDRKEEEAVTGYRELELPGVEQNKGNDMEEDNKYKIAKDEIKEKKGLFSIFDGRRKKDTRGNYERALQLTMGGYAVAEDTPYEEEEWGKTIYIEEDSGQKERTHRLCTSDGKTTMQLDRPSITIGKKKEEADLVLEEVSVSRIHARIIKEQNDFYLEDLNSTNGTYKNGLRMQPYEKRKLEEGDEIRFGKKEFVFY